MINKRLTQPWWLPNVVGGKKADKTNIIIR